MAPRRSKKCVEACQELILSRKSWHLDLIVDIQKIPTIIAISFANAWSRSGSRSAELKSPLRVRFHRNGDNTPP